MCQTNNQYFFFTTLVTLGQIRTHHLQNHLVRIIATTRTLLSQIDQTHLYRTTITTNNQLPEEKELPVASCC